MSQIYDNWERLVRATLRREHLRLVAQRTPSDLSLSSSRASPLRVSSFKLPSLLIGEAFDYDQILRASNYFSNSKLIRHGRSGDLFYGVLDDGTPVVVKNIDLSSARKESYYISEVEAFNRASHSRLVPLIGHCLDNLNEKFLVYKHMTNRDLSSSFFSEVDPDDECGLRSLDPIRRLKIATGAAEALCYLHHECFPPLVHRDVQASSILLDANYEVRLGSLSGVCAQKKENGSNQNQITRFPQGSKQGTSGQYNAYCAYDVYCFGKVLLELVTGKLGFSAAKAKDFEINDWMRKALPYINITEKKLVRQILDPSLAIAEDLLTEVWGMAVTAKACLHPQPTKRPLITHVLLALQNPVKVRGILEQSIIGASKLRRAKPKIVCEDFTSVTGSMAVDSLQKGQSSTVPVPTKDIPEQYTTDAPKPKTACDDFTDIIGSMTVGTLNKGKDCFTCEAVIG